MQTLVTPLLFKCAVLTTLENLRLNLRLSAHERFFAAAAKQPERFLGCAHGR